MKLKLRNKKTGEIGEIRYESHALYVDTDGGFTYWIRTLAELNEEWEDYKPAEPLIKDEQVRKAVRAWAEANAPTTRLKFDEDNARLSSETSCIEFDDYQPFSRLKDDEEYTIAALCGDSEEDEDEA